MKLFEFSTRLKVRLKEVLVGIWVERSGDLGLGKLPPLDRCGVSKTKVINYVSGIANFLEIKNSKNRELKNSF